MRMRRIVIGAVIVVVLALVAPMALYMGASMRACADFTPVDTGAVADGVVAVRDGNVNAWAFRSGDSWILFDAGMSARRLLSGLAAVGIAPNSVSALFLTHTDYDHVGAAGRFPNAAVYISDRERLMVNGTVRRAFVFHNRLRVPYRAMRDGETVMVGSRAVTAFVTPGHTVGSACYLVDGAYLVAGDSMAIRSGRIETFSDFFNMDTATQRVSIKDLFARSELDRPVTVLTGHYGILRDYRAGR